MAETRGESRVPTGVPGLDEILHGGLVSQNSYLVVGGAGTGKTVLSFQWLREGERRGERTLYVTLAEPGSKIERNVSNFGWSLDGIEIVDLTRVDDVANPPSEYGVFPPSDVEQTSIWATLYETIASRKPDRVVIDSITQLRYLAPDEYQFRKQVLALVAFLDRHGCTSFLVFEPTELERETSVALAVDGILRLNREISPRRVIGLRSIEIEKIRGSGFMSGLHPLRIGEDGIRIFPHRIETPTDAAPGSERLESGVSQLDELLGGGIETGTTTIISGPCGVGKSTLGLQFLTQAAESGKRAVLFTFEESVASILWRCRAIGIPIETMIESDRVRVARINPLELYPDEFLALVRTAVEEEGFEFVMIDSLRGYDLAMEEFGTMGANVANLVTYLNGKGVTTFVVNEIEQITGDFKMTEFAVSYIADNVILVRYAEYASRVIRIVACLKKRLGGFQPELRQMHITTSGIEVSERLEHLRGILTGVPTY